MALVGPILDDRTFAQLREELVGRIPVYAPEWTDHNESDPGIALLELFAHLGESLLFRFNQIPDATKVAFLRLLGVAPRPAQVARTWLALTTERPDGVQVLAGRQARAGAVVFETDGEVVAWPLEVRAVGKVEAGDPEGDEAQVRAEQRRRDDALARLPQGERLRLATAEERYYTAVAVPADPSATDSAPLDVATTVDQSLWVALLATATTDAAQLRGRIVFVGVALDEDIGPPPFDLVPAPGSAGTPTLLRADELVADPPGVLWELWTGPDEPGFTPLSVPADSTRGLSTTGVVSIEIPQDFPAHERGADSSGDHLSPPRLDDPKQAERVIGWLRARRPPGEPDAIRRIRWVGVNVVGAAQQVTVAPELIGTGTGDPGRTHPLAQPPVVPGSVALEVEEPDGWTPWTEVDDFSTSGPVDRHYTLDPVAGLVRFGPARTRVPQVGERIRVTSYRSGGGTAGNAAAGAITSLSGVAGVKVTNVLPATGGADAATLAEALDEVPAAVHRRDRAVTADDFSALAAEVSGVRRAEARPNLHPDTPTQPAAGVTSVIVFPDEDRRSPGAPTPDVALLRRVAAHLNPRRLLTAELYVIPPTYRRIAVSVAVQVRAGHQVDAVRRWVELILRQYLAPVPPFGPDGDGWPLGRVVRRSELEAVAVQVQGVESVERLRLARADAPGVDAERVELERWEVPELVAVTVVAGTDPPDPAVGLTPPAPGPQDPVFVPLPPDTC